VLGEWVRGPEVSAQASSRALKRPGRKAGGSLLVRSVGGALGTPGLGG